MTIDERRLDRLITVLEGLVRSGTAGTRPTIISREDERAASAQRESAKRLGEAQESVRAALEKLAKTSKNETEKYERAQQALNDALADAAAAQADASRKDERLRRAAQKSFGHQIAAYRDLTSETHGLSSQLAAAQKNASLFAASLLETHREINESSAHYTNFINKCAQSISQLDKEFLKSAGVFDDLSDAVKKNLSASDFAKLRRSLGDAQTIITENLAKIGIEDLGRFVQGPEFEQRLRAPSTEGERSAEKFHEALVAVARQLQEQGHLQGVDLSDVNRINIRDLAQRVAQASTQINSATRGLDTNARNANTALGYLTRGVDGLRASFEDYRRNLSSTASIMASFAAAGVATRNIYTSLVDFNIAQVPLSFMEVQKASVRLGMGFDETVRFLKENKTLVSLYGAEQGGALLGSLKTTFETFGYNAKQAAELIPGGVEAAIGTGINVRSGEELNNFMNKTMKSFESISGIVDVSAKEYMRLNAELLSNSDIQGTLLGMDKQRAGAYADQLVALRNNYVQMGLSTQQAQELVKAQEAQKRERVTSRVRAAAKAQVLAQTLGMSGEEGARYAQLRRKAFLTDEEKKEMFAMEKRMAVLSEQRMQSAYAQGEGAGMAFQTTFESLSEGMESRLQTGAAAAVKERAGLVRTPEEAAAAAAAAKGSEELAAFSNVVNSVKSLMDNEFTRAIKSAGSALLGLVGQGGGGGAGILSGILGGLLGGGIARGGIGGAAGGIFSTITGLLGRAGPLISGMVTGIPSLLARGTTLIGSLVTGIPGLLASGTGLIGGLVSSVGSVMAGAGAMITRLVGMAGPLLTGLSSLLPMLGQLAAVAGAAYGGWKVGEALNEYVLNPLAEKITGTQGETVGTALYGAVDTAMGWFGASDADKMREAEEKAKLEFQARKATQPPAQPAPSGTTTGVNTATTPVAGMLAPADVAAKVTAADLTATSISDSARSLVSSSDSVTHERLSEIAQTLSSSLEALRLLVELGTKPTELRKDVAGRSIPTSYTAMTGKLPVAY